MTPFADAGGIDYKVPLDESGIWQRSTQKAVLAASVTLTVAGALWEGGETQLGRTFWQSVDGGAFGSLSSEALKRITTRVRPRDTDDPGLWFQGGSNHSFPSGEVTMLSALVIPFVLEYGKTHPAFYALELLPAYDMIGRVKVHAHWQTDVIAGFALGTATGYLSHSLPAPVTLQVLPHGFAIGIKAKF